MTTAETWSLIFDGFTAVGTVGAVIISLWLSLHQRKRFHVKEIKVDRMLYSGGDGKIKSDDNKMLVLFENLQGYPLEIHAIDLKFIHDKTKTSGTEFRCKNEVVAPMSFYELQIPLARGWAANSLRNSKKIICEFKTSFGNKTMPFPDFWKQQLCDSLEFEQKEKIL